jgi:hypothetical protein
MLKVTSSVELAAASSYVGWGCECIEFRSAQGDSVSVKMTTEQIRQLAKQLNERYNAWLKDQADKVQKAQQAQEAE